MIIMIIIWIVHQKTVSKFRLIKNYSYSFIRELEKQFINNSN